MQKLSGWIALLSMLGWRVNALVHRPGADCEWIAKIVDLNHTFVDPSPTTSILDALGYSQPSRLGRPICAVVGNSPKLLNRSYGKLIDESDVVMRMNSAGAGKWSDWNLLSLGKKQNVLTANITPRALYIVEEIAGRADYNGTIIVMHHTEQRKKIKKMQQSSIFMRIRQNCSKCWWYDVEPVVELLRSKIGGYHPSSGLVFLPLLMNSCSEIRLFGFSTCREDSSRDRYTGKKVWKGESYKAEVPFRAYLSYCVVDPTIAIFG